jgi:hypothetical protein
MCMCMCMCRCMCMCMYVCVDCYFRQSLSRKQGLETSDSHSSPLPTKMLLISQRHDPNAGIMYLADTVARIRPSCSSRMAAAYLLKFLAAPHVTVKECLSYYIYGSGSSPVGEGWPRGNLKDTLEGKDDLVTQDT